MADIAVLTGSVGLPYPEKHETLVFSHRCGVEIDAGDLCYLNASGVLALSDASATETARREFVALDSGGVGQVVRVVGTGAILSGYTLPQGVGDVLYLSDTAGAFGDEPGTVSVLAGRVTVLESGRKLLFFGHEPTVASDIGAEVAGATAAHAALEGTAAHGLGTAALLTSTAVGEDLVTAVDEEAARLAILAASLREPTIFIATPTRNFGLTDEGHVLAATSIANTTAFQMTTAVSSSFAIGAQVAVERHSTSATTIACDSGITLNGNAVGGGIGITKRFGRVTLRKIAATEWVAWGDWYPLVATYTVTTAAPSEIHTLNSFGVADETIIDWGDGTTSAYTGTALRTHTYTDAGTYVVTIQQPQNVTTFDVRDNRVTLDSSTMSVENVSVFVATGLRIDGTFDSADVSAWRPTTFYLYSMPAGYAGTFDSVDVSAWRPTSFYLYSMPAGYGGTFNSADVSAWRPTIFLLLSMPAGYGGTFDSADVSAWRPTTFLLHSMPAGYTITISATGFTQWTTTSNFQMQSNALAQPAVDEILWQLYQATATPRTATAGTIIVSGTNAAPSGAFQPASACPVTVATDGNEVAHELLNDTCAAGFNVWATVVTS